MVSLKRPHLSVMAHACFRTSSITEAAATEALVVSGCTVPDPGWSSTSYSTGFPPSPWRVCMCMHVHFEVKMPLYFREKLT